MSTLEYQEERRRRERPVFPQLERMLYNYVPRYKGMVGRRPSRRWIEEDDVLAVDRFIAGREL